MTITGLAFGSPTTATANEASLPTSTTKFFSLSEQHEAETIVERFSQSHTMPELLPGSSTDAYAAFQRSLEAYWSSVPWESVYAQWDCRLESKPTMRRGVAQNGMPFVVLEESHECGDPDIGAEFAGLVEPRDARGALRSADTAAYSVRGRSDVR
ncbi:hypothetical protein [Agromyces silvae]|uniref:hypothetical protein n=1 Tax=Agromyces silvae TaxID=3388266 RepID=UPI00280C3CBC|nr:hypothetical protein [Agromyces protaetiae]